MLQLRCESHFVMRESFCVVIELRLHGQARASASIHAQSADCVVHSRDCADT